jgi:hypothetical protein
MGACEVHGAWCEEMPLGLCLRPSVDGRDEDGTQRGTTQQNPTHPFVTALNGSDDDEESDNAVACGVVWCGVRALTESSSTCTPTG